MGVSLFAIMFVMLFLYRRIITSRSYVTISGKAFRPRVMDVGPLRWVLLGICSPLRFRLSVALPVMTLALCLAAEACGRLPGRQQLDARQLSDRLTMNAVRSALSNSLLLGVATACIGVVLMGLLSWIIYRSRIPGSGVIEYIVMFPQAVPRLVFAFGMMWAWLMFPVPIYGTLWLLLIAYLTVFLPFGIRTISGVMLQIDKSLEECAQMCGASWSFRIRTVTIPLLRPGLAGGLAAAVRCNGAGTRRVDPFDGTALEGHHAGHRRILVRPSSELTAAMALMQTLVVALAMSLLARFDAPASDPAPTKRCRWNRLCNVTVEPPQHRHHPRPPISRSTTWRSAMARPGGRQRQLQCASPENNSPCSAHRAAARPRRCGRSPGLSDRAPGRFGSAACRCILSARNG